MTLEAVASRSDGMSDASLEAATGRTWEQWFQVLDAAGAAAWTHPQIAAWLSDQHGVPPWWCQTVTVGFEQARGLRLPGQRADGTFEVSASRTLPWDTDAALDAVIAAVTAELGEPPVSQSRGIAYPTARWNLTGPEYLVARANPSKSGKTSVALTHHRLAEPGQVPAAKAALRAWLAATTLVT